MGNIGSGSGSSYPGTLDTQTAVEVDSPAGGKTKARAAVPNDLAACVLAVETALGTNPQGSKSDVKSFLQIEHNADGTHKTIDGFAISQTAGANTVAVSTAGGILTGWQQTVYTSQSTTSDTSAATFNQALSGTVTNSSGFEYASQQIMSIAGTIETLYAQATQNTLNGNSVITLRKNGSNTALTATITAASTAVFSDTSHSVTFVAGDLLNWQIVNAGSSGGLVVTISAVVIF